VVGGMIVCPHQGGVNVWEQVVGQQNCPSGQQSSGGTQHDTVYTHIRVRRVLRLHLCEVARTLLVTFIGDTNTC
jgi:hypothetical protein